MTEPASGSDNFSEIPEMTSDGRFVKADGKPNSSVFGESYFALDKDTGNEVSWNVINIENKDPCKLLVLLVIR